MTTHRFSLKRLVSPDTITPSSGQHWDLLDGLRGVAILMVVASHAFYANPNGPEFLKLAANFIGGGAIGVQMFFVLSGFLISYPLLKAKSERPDSWYVTGYATRRALKIFPPFLLCILLLAAVYRYFDGTFARTSSGLQWLVGLPHFLYIPEAAQFNGSFWSLWVELGFYVVLPLGFFALRWQKNPIITAAWLAAILFIGSTLASYLTWPSHAVPSDYMLYVIGRFPNGLSNFAWGVIFAALFFARRQKPIAVSMARLGYIGLGLLLAALFWLGWVSSQGIQSQWYTHAVKQLLADLATFFLLFFIFDRQSFGARLLSLPGLKYLGVISYEWFLLHQPVLSLFRQHLGSAGGNMAKYLVITLVPLLLTLLMSVLIYHFFSAPIIEWGRKRIATQREQK